MATYSIVNVTGNYTDPHPGETTRTSGTPNSDPTNGLVYYHDYFGASGSAVMKSTDYGNTFTNIGLSNVPGQIMGVQSILLDPALGGDGVKFLTAISTSKYITEDFKDFTNSRSITINATRMFQTPWDGWAVGIADYYLKATKAPTGTGVWQTNVVCAATTTDTADAVYSAYSNLILVACDTPEGTIRAINPTDAKISNAIVHYLPTVNPQAMASSNDGRLLIVACTLGNAAYSNNGGNTWVNIANIGTNTLLYTECVKDRFIFFDDNNNIWAYHEVDGVEFIGHLNDLSRNDNFRGKMVVATKDQSLFLTSSVNPPLYYKLYVDDTPASSGTTVWQIFGGGIIQRSAL